MRRLRLHVQGVVQGVGFRPFVFSLATRLHLTGFVGNDSGGVFIEVEGPVAALDAFRADLVAHSPSLAHIDDVAVAELPMQGSSDFRIVASTSLSAASTLVSPDLCICTECLAELVDPASRRYRYPFTNCTNCGPRFTITRDVPYDRPRTTMAAFSMCPACQAEYDDPRDRRFHAQPNACPVCGPQIYYAAGKSNHRVTEINAVVAASAREHKHAVRGEAALIAACQALAAGKIIAVKGLGGFHLACDATNSDAVHALRMRKGRVDKPFAVMVADVAAARLSVYVSEGEAALLASRQRPIVLLRKRAGSPLSDLVAPGNGTVGVMLPYTPLHYLLFIPETQALCPHGAPLALVMTSANLSAEPIVKDNAEARTKLASLADAFLMHDRAIHVHCDDSVIRVVPEDVAMASEPDERKLCGSERHQSVSQPPQQLPIRRSRGYAPFPVKLPFAVPPILAVGGELKSTFCLTRNDHAFMSQHIGDMENLETLQVFDAAVEHFQTIFRTEPERIACDLHPRYLATRWAVNNAAGRPVTFVQHHHAHIASVMAEHGLDGAQPVIGLSFDGTGYGTDGAIWGGEVLVADYRGFERMAHLAYAPLPGGDVAVKRPYRMALAHLWAAGIPWTEDLPPVAACPAQERTILQRQLARNLNTVATSSMGRLFDAVAALLGVRQTVTYEAQGAIELESICAEDDGPGYAFGIATQARNQWLSSHRLDAPRMATVANQRQGEQDHHLLIDPAPLLTALVADLRQGVPVPIMASRFHSAVADLAVQVCIVVRKQRRLTDVALSGGVFQNVRLLGATVARLAAAGFVTYTNKLVPPNDGGLALGQAVVAAQSLDSTGPPEVL